MPNHVTNTMLVHGPKEAVEKAFALVWQPPVPATDEQPEQDGRVDFGLVLPMPADLQGSTSPTSIMTEEEIAAALAEREKLFEKNPAARDLFGGEVGITQAEAERRVTEYGALNWYDWAVAHWGTKWNAYESALKLALTPWSYNVVRAEGTPEQWGFVVEFQTAWAQPELWLKALEQAAPGVQLEVLSLDEGSYQPIIYTSGENEWLDHLSLEQSASVDW